MISRLDKADSRQAQHVNIHVVTRSFPIENTIGSHTYLLALVGYLKQLGFQVRLLLLDSSPGGNIPVFVIPASARALFRVSARNNLQVLNLLVRFRFFIDYFVSPIWMVYYIIAKGLQNLPLAGWHDAINRVHQILHKFFIVRNDKMQPWDAFASPEEIAFFGHRWRKWKPHVAIADYAFLSDVFDAVPPCESALKVILTHDVRHRRTREFRTKGIDMIGESELELEKERKLLAKAQLLLAIQEEDAASLKDMMPQCEVLTVPMPAVLQSNLAIQVSGRCLFVGSPANHNVYGLSWLLENVWPLVLRSVPYATLHVCGTVCDAVNREVKNVLFLGRVSNLRVEYGAAEVCLVPLVVGSGLKIKLVEALSYGRACVSTPIGIQGIREVQDKAVIVAETTEDFAMAIQNILTDSDRRQLMENEARSFVETRLSPERIYQPLVDRIFDICCKPGG